MRESISFTTPPSVWVFCFFGKVTHLLAENSISILICISLITGKVEHFPYVFQAILFPFCDFYFPVYFSFQDLSDFHNNFISPFMLRISSLGLSSSLRILSHFASFKKFLNQRLSKYIIKYINLLFCDFIHPYRLCLCNLINVQFYFVLVLVFTDNVKALTLSETFIFSSFFSV